MSDDTTIKTMIYPAACPSLSPEVELDHSVVTAGLQDDPVWRTGEALCRRQLRLAAGYPVPPLLVLGAFAALNAVGEEDDE